MNPSIIIGMAVALAVSLAGNAWLFGAVSDQREEIGVLKSDRDSALNAAVVCSDGVKQLQEKAARQAEAAKKALAAARADAVAAGRRADAERSRPQAVPGDECASAAVESREWLRARRGEK